ncbi:MAG: hypothetical protein JWR55_2680, partial [Aeromicrobium sp.]|nr:hypothetical protein [Aeromicrobium sp.]
MGGAIRSPGADTEWAIDTLSVVSPTAPAVSSTHRSSAVPTPRPRCLGRTSTTKYAPTPGVSGRVVTIARPIASPSTDASACRRPRIGLVRYSGSSSSGVGASRSEPTTCASTALRTAMYARNSSPCGPSSDSGGTISRIVRLIASPYEIAEQPIGLEQVVAVVRRRRRHEL